MFYVILALLGLRSLRRTHSVNFSEVNRRGELSVPSANSQRYYINFTRHSIFIK